MEYFSTGAEFDVCKCRVLLRPFFHFILIVDVQTVLYKPSNAIDLCPSVCVFLSVTNRCFIEAVKRFEQVFGTDLSIDLSYSVLKLKIKLGYLHK